MAKSEPGYCEKCELPLEKVTQETRTALRQFIWEYWSCPLHGKEWKNAHNRN